MATIRDKIKDIVRDTLASRGTSTKYRLAVVSDLNNDGTATVLLDGASQTVTPIFPVVQGQNVALIFASDGTVSAVPTRAYPETVQTIHPPFFTGGIIKFVSPGLTPADANGFFSIYFQQAFSSNIYRFVEPAFPGYRPFGVWFSPDGTRIVVVLGKHLTTDIHYRVYSIGQNLSGTVLLDPANKIFQLSAKFLFEIKRTMNWEGSKANDATTRTGEWAWESNSWIAALDSDPKQLYWVEHQFLEGSFVFVPDPNATPNGTPMEIIYFYKLDPSGNPLQIGQWTVAFGDQPGPRFDVRALFMFSNVGLDINLVLNYGQNSGIFDAASAELFGSYSTPFGDGDIFAAHDNIAPSISHAVFAIMKPSGAAYNASAVGGPATSVPNGPTILFTSLVTPFVYGQFPFGYFAPLFQMVRSKKFHTMLYYGPLDTSSRVVYEDATKLTKTEGVFTNTIASDPSLTSACLFFMSSLSGGLFLDQSGHLRNVVSKDGGKTFTIDTDPTKYLKISPGQASPTILRLTTLFGSTAITGVSTL